MYCAQCGAKIEEGQRFCSACGGPVSQAMVAPGQGRMQKHLKLLGILWVAISVLHLVPGIGLIFFGSFALPFIPFHVRALVVPIAMMAGIFFLASAILGVLAGWGLLTYRPWARILAIILGIIALIHVPFGTALGIYTLWVLLPTESDEEYRRLSRAT